MRSQKGITLMSLLVYVIAFLMVTGIVGAITTFFYTNYSFLDKKSAIATEYSKLNLVFVEESKAKGNSIFGFQSDVEDVFDIVEIESTTRGGEYESKYELLEAMDGLCEDYYNTYILFYDENILGWRADEKTIYYNQSVLCNNVEKFLITKTLQNGRTVLNVYVEFDSKSYSTKYTF